MTTTKRKTQYCVANINNKLTLYHRYVMDIKNPKIQIDHINLNGLDNRKDNLRACTNNQNNYNKNKRKNTSSKYKGVCYRKFKNKWLAQIAKDYKRYFIGYFKTEEDAARAYDTKAKELFGEFANLNFKTK